uniref:Uncharacterized protein n=1 Tax=Ciona savignyi TaxID=51511 RepID=H2ZIC4_CIOSA
MDQDVPNEKDDALLDLERRKALLQAQLMDDALEDGEISSQEQTSNGENTMHETECESDSSSENKVIVIEDDETEVKKKKKDKKKSKHRSISPKMSSPTRRNGSYDDKTRSRRDRVKDSDTDLKKGTEKRNSLRKESSHRGSSTHRRSDSRSRVERHSRDRSSYNERDRRERDNERFSRSRMSGREAIHHSAHGIARFI